MWSPIGVCHIRMLFLGVLQSSFSTLAITPSDVGACMSTFVAVAGAIVALPAFHCQLIEHQKHLDGVKVPPYTWRGCDHKVTVS